MTTGRNGMFVRYWYEVGRSRTCLDALSEETLTLAKVYEHKVAALGAPRGGQFKDWFSALAISPDQQTVAAADIAGMIHVWSLG